MKKIKTWYVVNPNFVRISANDDLVYVSADWLRILHAVPVYISIYFKFPEIDGSDYLTASSLASLLFNTYASGKKPSRGNMLSMLQTHSLNTQTSLKNALCNEANISPLQMQSFWISNTLILKTVPFSDILMHVLARYRSNATWIMYEVFLKPPQIIKDNNPLPPTNEGRRLYHKYHVHLYSDGVSTKKKATIVSLDEKFKMANVKITNRGSPSTYENGKNRFDDFGSRFTASVEKAWSLTKGEGTVVGFMNFCPFSAKDLLAYKPPHPGAEISDLQKIHDSGLLKAASTFGISGQAVAPAARVIGAAASASSASSIYGFSIAAIYDLLDDAQFLVEPNGDSSSGADVVVLSSYVTMLDSGSSFRDSFLELEIWRQLVKVWDMLGIIPVMAAGSVSEDDDFIDILRSLSRVLIVGSVSGETGTPSLFSARGMSSYNWNGRLLPDFMAPGEPIDLAHAAARYYVDLDTMTSSAEAVIGQGTSFAASSVAFTIALMRSVAPNLYLDDVVAILKETAIRPFTWDQIESYNSMESHYLLDTISFRDPNSTLCYPNVLYGNGIIDPFRAVRASCVHEGSGSTPRRLRYKIAFFLENMESMMFKSSATITFYSKLPLIVAAFFPLVALI